jgi:putative ABC transport system permease protein
LRSIPGVAEVQAIRSIEGEHEGRAVVVMALDPASHGLPITDGEWDDLAGPFWSGLGVLVSENLAHKAGLARGQDLALRTPSGAHTVRILGVFADFQNGGDLGCIALSRGAFREWWDDRLITRARLWLSRDADISTIRAAVESRYGDSHGLHALSFAQARAGVAELIRSCFAISNALAFIALVVSFAGVVNFLLAAVLDRTSELRVLNCVGVTPGQIGAAVVDEGSLIGSVGAAAGVVAGVGLSAIIVLHSVPMVNGWRFAWRFSWPSAAVFAAAVVVLGAGAGIGPARHAIARSLRPPELRE